MAQGPLSVLHDEVAATQRIVAAVTVEQLADTTPCVGFDVRALINHMCMGNDFLRRVVEGEKATPDYDRDFVGGDHVDAYTRWAGAVSDAFAAPGALDRSVHFPMGELPATVALWLTVLEAVVHRWDLARATRQDPDIDPQVAEMVLDAVQPVIVDEMRAASPGEASATVPFGPAIEIGDGASATDRLVAFLGRNP